MASDQRENHPWEIIKGSESHKAYQAFCCYRDLGPARTLVNAYELSIVASGRDVGCKRLAVPGTWSRWRRENKWVERVQAFDLFNEQEYRLKQGREDNQKYLERLNRIRTLAEDAAIARLELSKIGSENAKSCLEELARQAQKEIENNQFIEEDGEVQSKAITALLDAIAKLNIKGKEELSVIAETMDLYSVREKLGEIV